jgi:hypothetical protein
MTQQIYDEASSQIRLKIRHPLSYGYWKRKICWFPNWIHRSSKLCSLCECGVVLIQTCVFRMFVFCSSLIHTPIQYKCPIKGSNRITPAYLNVATYFTNILNLTHVFPDQLSMWHTSLSWCWTIRSTYESSQLNSLQKVDHGPCSWAWHIAQYLFFAIKGWVSSNDQLST